jgi:peptidoglycan/xylan/chitin deacetylase (PgdA/CDA1 family)
MQNSRPRYNILLSFDLEEFDIPNEYGSSLSVEEQLAVTRQGLTRLLPLLEQLSIQATFFTTAFFAQQDKALIKQIASKYEVASHAFYHSRFSEEDIINSKLSLEEITGQTVFGFRMPRLAPVDRKLIKDAGYFYDASLNPTWLPGRYNNLRKPRTLFTEDQLYVLPSSVTPHLRFPLFWLSFKNIPLFIIKQWSRQVLKKDHYLCLYLHPWEFADLEKFQSLPFYTRKPCGQQLLDKLSVYLIWLKSIGNFTTIYAHIKDNM